MLTYSEHPQDVNFEHILQNALGCIIFDLTSPNMLHEKLNGELVIVYSYSFGETSYRRLQNVTNYKKLVLKKLE